LKIISLSKLSFGPKARELKRKWGLASHKNYIKAVFEVLDRTFEEEQPPHGLARVHGERLPRHGFGFRHAPQRDGPFQFGDQGALTAAKGVAVTEAAVNRIFEFLGRELR